MRVKVFPSGESGSGVAVDPHVDLAAAQLQPVHHAARALRHLGGLEPHHPAALGLAVLHLDVGVEHVACGESGFEELKISFKTRYC